MTGTLIQKIAGQPTPSTSAPPRIGPAAALTPATPAHTPIARARSRASGKALAMIDSVVGISIEAPTAFVPAPVSI